MKCPKCKGLMYTERFSDFYIVFDVWKCVNCGALIDRTILENQKGPSRLRAPMKASELDLVEV